ncbi:MAG: phosphatase PAP2 family protein [Planctomycetota bacterium]
MNLTERPVSAHDRVWVFYLLTATSASWIGGLPAGPGRGNPVLFTAIHAVFLSLMLGLRRFPAGTPRGNAARAAFSIVAIPTVFTALALVLPGVHPEPFEFTWIAFDRWLCGTDPTVSLQVLYWGPAVDVLQIAYAIFYLVPIVAVVLAGLGAGRSGFADGLDRVVAGFLLSYLGYLIWPTIGPETYLPHDRPIEGPLCAASVHAAIVDAEIHRWNCFPSGHTMLGVVSLAVVAKHARRHALAFAVPVVLLVAATLVLRYHYVADVVAGLLGVPLTALVVRRVRG